MSNSITCNPVCRAGQTTPSLVIMLYWLYWLAEGRNGNMCKTNGKERKPNRVFTFIVLHSVGL